LQKAGAIAMGGATCEIIERAALERRACECYGIISTEFRQLNARAPAFSAGARHNIAGRAGFRHR
jgi:hypothetical protein